MTSLEAKRHQDEKEDLEILDKDDAEVKKSKKAKQLTRATNKKGTET